MQRQHFLVAYRDGLRQTAIVVSFLTMRAYLFRRFLLIPVTLIGVTLLVFGLTRILPGGPMEKAMQAATQAEEGHRGARGPQSRCRA